MDFAKKETNIKASDKAVLRMLGDDHEYFNRYLRVRDLAKKVRVSEYLITNACNIRCKGCWFYEYDFDKKSKDVNSKELIKDFLNKERERGINTALIIGGEPTLFPHRIEAFQETMDYVTISTNGLKALPVDGFENTAVLISLFGGGKLDDELRAIKPNGKRFNGLFDQALKNYKYDERAFWIYAITEDGLPYIDETVKKIQDNGNRVNFNFYSKYDSTDPLYQENRKILIEEALRVKSLYPETIVSHPYYINTIITGESHWDKFGYSTCPSISVDNPEHSERIKNGSPTLPKFNAWASDLKTVNFCCTSGHCESCQDSQAIFSWLMVSMAKFRGSPELFKTWIELAESYWDQFIWAKSERNKKNKAEYQSKIIAREYA